MLNVALPKGRLGEKVYSMFASAGFECPEALGDSRKLIFVNEEKGVYLTLVSFTIYVLYLPSNTFRFSLPRWGNQANRYFYVRYIP